MNRTATAAIFAFWVLLFQWLILNSSAQGGTAATPDRIQIKVQDAMISTDDVNYVTILNSPVAVDLDEVNPSPFARKDLVPTGTYKILRFTVAEISWHAAWSGSNPSPCDGAVEGESSGVVNLGGRTDIYFKTPDLGGNTLSSYLSNPPVSGYVGDSKHPFVLSASINVLKDQISTISLILGVAHALSCDGLSVFKRTDDGNSSPQRVLIGPATGLNGPQGVYLDPSAGELGIINGNSNSVSFYQRTAEGNSPSLRTLIGPATLLNHPFGIAFDPNHNEIFITNKNNHSITVFDRNASGNLPPLHSINGLFTGLSSPAGIYLDPTHEEIVVANSGNNSVTIHYRTATEDALPLRNIIRNLVVTTGNRTINLKETGGVGKVNATIATGTYRSGEELADAVQTAIEAATSRETAFSVIYDATSGRFVITVTALASSVSEVILNWEDAANSTAAGLLGFADGSGPLVAGSSDISDSGDKTGLNHPCGVYTANNEIYVTNSGNNTVTVYNRTDSGEISPSRVLAGDLTGLQDPCAIIVDTENHEMIVANRGNKSVTVYNQSASDNTAPIRVIQGLNSGLNQMGGIYLDTAENEIGVAGSGQQVVMAGPPDMFPSASNSDASSSALAGNYNVVAYGVNIKGINNLGGLIPSVFSERGTVSFDSTASWPMMIFRPDSQIERQIIEPACSVDPNVGIDQSGFYGVNSDGSFYAFLKDIQGSLHGAFLPDGSAFIASMIDSSNRLQLLYGVKETGDAIPHLTFDGTINGAGTSYAFTTYAHDLFAIGRPDNSDFMRFIVGIGSAQTDAANILGGNSDANFVTVINPMGLVTDPISSGAVFRDGFLPVRLPGQAYASHAGGLLDSASSGLAGAATADGGSWIFMKNTKTKDKYGCNTDIGFGLGLRQNPEVLFGTENIKGTYFLSGFGDRFDTVSRTTVPFSTGAQIVFDGAGGAEMVWSENVGGAVLSDRARFNYQIGSRLLPGAENLSVNVQVINLWTRPSEPYASALISQDGKMLAFFRNLNPDDSANPTRLLGMAVFQYP